ncbi:MAG: hypothetical protein RLZZ292_814 [Bacteroidota bacterium]|jgi:plasmid stabilization system protein ParE
MYTIYWTPNARESYAAILEFVIENFSLDAALSMDDKMENRLLALQKNRYLCPISEILPNIRKCVITPQLSLAYRVQNDKIELVSFFNNRSNHSF